MSDYVKATKKEIVVSSVLIAFAMALVVAVMIVPHHGISAVVASVSRICLFVSIIFGFRGIVYASPKGIYNSFNTQAVFGAVGTLAAFVSVF